MSTMNAKNPEYDFKWCPGCGDFGVRRAMEFAMADRMARLERPMENNVVISGIGCSGNLVHLLEGPQPYGFHGIHGRTLPIALGVKMARQDLNVVVVAGDGDFLSIGMEHIAPQAMRNLDVCAVVMDNGIYGLTKGQSSPTTPLSAITTSTPYGKMEEGLNPLDYYLSIGVSFIASGFSAKPRDLAKLITAGMDHTGFAIVHVQSPCTTYNDTYEALKGSDKKGIEPLLYDVPESHDPTDKMAAYSLVRQPGIPVGVIYRNDRRPSLGQRVEEAYAKAKPKSVQALLETFEF
ncbi:MAG: 2-oxoacid:ferredoxin oxidoreductase subunit beta [Chloroflexi bacterium]|nr:2-oxoacid:ferredoxin oxidoreductase subunit beta [Chloroflexota bacterium]